MRVILNFKVILLLSIVTLACFTLERVLGGILDEMQGSTPMTCAVTDVAMGKDRAGALIVVRCGSTDVVMSADATLEAIRTKAVSASCAVYQGKHFGDREWRCKV